MPCSAHDMRSGLIGKLDCEESQGRRHTKYKLFHEGQLIATTYMSRGVSELSDSLVSRIAQELCVQTSVLKGICDCPYGLSEYLRCYNPDLNPHRSGHAHR